jgi:hypothetical protein
MSLAGKWRGEKGVFVVATEDAVSMNAHPVSADFADLQNTAFFSLPNIVFWC